LNWKFLFLILLACLISCSHDPNIKSRPIKIYGKWIDILVETQNANYIMSCIEDKKTCVVWCYDERDPDTLTARYKTLQINE